MKVVDYWIHRDGKAGIDFLDMEGNPYTKVLGKDDLSPEEIEILWPYCVSNGMIIPEYDINT
jgi:hypothetical protein